MATLSYTHNNGVLQKFFSESIDYILIHDNRFECLRCSLSEWLLIMKGNLTEPLKNHLSIYAFSWYFEWSPLIMGFFSEIIDLDFCTDEVS